MSGINRVTILGNVGQQPKIKKGDGYTIANFSVATSKKWKNKNGDKTEHTEWHNVVIYNRLAEIVEQYVNKGDKIYIEGEIKTSKYKDKEGIERSKTEIIGNVMQMLGGNKNKSEQEENPYKQAQDQNDQYQQEPPLEDDIPF